MGFSILNKQNIAITLSKLDEEAAIFWKVPLEDYYAAPKGHSLNWTIMIGRMIHEATVAYTKGWDNIKCSLMITQTASLGLMGLNQQIDELKNINNYLKPYFELIDYWKAKGYKPLKTEE